MSNINVLYRIKNINKDDSIIQVFKSELKIENNKPRVNKKKRYKVFKNLNIFDKYDTNDIIFDSYFKYKLEEFINNDVPTFSTMAYGQTGSGKTYTLFGTRHNLGVIYNITNYLIDNNIEPELSCTEIYNNKLTDLLNNKEEFKIFDTPNNIIFSKPIQRNYIDSRKSSSELIGKILKMRATGSTKLNDASSRSHLIVTLYFHGKKIYIIDLAGNEKGKYSVANNRLKAREYIHINKSLFSLKECIRSISQKHTYIPYRNTKLTLLLKDIFFNNGVVTFIATLTPSINNYHDIIDTITFANSLQLQRIVLLMHQKINFAKLLDHYLNIITRFNILVSKDYKHFKKIDQEYNDTKQIDSKNIQFILSLIDNKIDYLQEIKKNFRQYV